MASRMPRTRARTSSLSGLKCIPRAGGLEPREGPVLRWVQLMKALRAACELTSGCRVLTFQASPQATPHFQLLEWQPQSIQDRHRGAGSGWL